jgi:cytochrome c oxidase subunit 2
MLAVMAVFAFVAANASGDAKEYAPVQAHAYMMRTRFFWILVVAGIIITLISVVDLPFAATRNATTADRTINVAGSQWYWNLSANSITAGESVIFNVTASDVNHGLGVYNEDMQLIGQTQAMPGYSNSLKLTFEKPGVYPLLCMEYCGLAHHAMISTLTVLPKGASNE